VSERAPRYDLVFRPGAVRSLRKLDRQVIARVRSVIEALRDDPRPPGAKMLTGSHGLLRIRFGDYRVLYIVEDDRRVVRIADVGHRSDIYR